MKCILSYLDYEKKNPKVIRVDNKKAEQLVKSGGFIYVPKSLWKSGREYK